MKHRVYVPAVLVSAVVKQAFGFLWYSPILFFQQWQELTGITEQEMNAANPLFVFGGSILVYFAQVYVLA